MAVLLFFLALAVAVGLVFAMGIGWLVLLPFLVAIGIAVWAALAFMRRPPSSVVRDAKRPELLGPGGPDDPGAR